MKPLTIYKASAGSGKTFRLAVEYIKLVIANPTAYRNILAVTFTNKATEEMKMRILSQLYGIWRQLPDSRQYAERVAEELDFSQEMVSERAGKALQNLLHNYSYFKVSTIDTFFQSVLRNLARELNLTANLRVELNDKQVEHQAVDRLIEDLQTSDLLLRWILDYIKENISEDKNWNVIQNIKLFGETIFKDYYKEHAGELGERMDEQGFFTRFTGQLTELQKSAATRMKDIAQAFFATIEAEGLEPDDFSQKKSGVAGFFLKLDKGGFDEKVVNSYVKKCIDRPEGWYSKSSPRASQIHALAEETLIPMLNFALEERPRQWTVYKSAEVTLRHLNQLRMLGSIEREVRELNAEANRFLLSDTQQFLHALIKDTDSPFIFEKIGTQLEHVMIDEFQDTSTVQWQNFKVLLSECMSHHDNSNLIVGDVKQSIYRFRSGDWRLLNQIDAEFPHPQEQLDIRYLDTNYRSCRNIIDFNNRFFELATALEYQRVCESVDEESARQVINAYADVKQKVPELRPQTGLVHVSLLPKEDYDEHVLEQTADTVRDLMARGVKQSQIAILVRNGKNTIPAIASYFMEQLKEVSIVSDEAFRLDSSVAVNLMMEVLHLLIHPDDQLSRARVVKVYQQEILDTGLSDNDLFLSCSDLNKLLPAEFAENAGQWLLMPLYELCEKILETFQLDRLQNESAYICAFFDQMTAYINDHTADVESFIKEWDEHICSQTIQSDEINVIRLITIHKSKGLEFDHVIIPYSDWPLESKHQKLLWCRPQEEPFNALPLVPVVYGKALQETIYASEYQEEFLQNSVDNLNLLYVAFTRAVKSLHIIGKRDAGGTRTEVIQNVLPSLADQLEGAELNMPDDKSLPIDLIFGCYEETKGKASESSENVFLQRIENKEIEIKTFKNRITFKQSNKSRDFIDGENERDQASYIQLGSILHQVFSLIRTRDDVENALGQLQLDGILYDDVLTQERIKGMIQKRLEDPRVAEWFSDKWQLFNECSILIPDAEGHLTERRPDRVMMDGQQVVVVDFKFGRAREEYHDQVHEYMALLSQMGYRNITGYLWYVYSNKIERV